jgi:tetratricopeptide (TPR) repeat protein/tRNA A-37 threonylcarbamoyl transferase component Bud32
MNEAHDPNRTVDIPSAPGDALDAGLAASFGRAEPPRSSLGNVRPVLLKEAEGESAHVVKPKSDAMPPPEQTGDRYQLSGEIARGGMGAVLRGRDVDIGRDLAVKVLLEKHAKRPEIARRFIEEAQIGGQLQHPGVVPVYDIGRFGERPFFTMKPVKGQTLAHLLAERADYTHDRPRFLAIALQVAQTLAYAHAKGVIHRDLKPANIMVGAFGEVQVMDWGLAKVLAEGGIADEERQRREREQPEDVTAIRTARSTGSTGSFGTDTEAGSLLGTPAYMPPEQANGDVALVDRRADVFGLGAILCEILTGKPPFVGRSAEEVRRKACNGDLADALARLGACGADADLVVLTKTCLSPEAVDRPKDALTVAQALAKYLDGVQERLRQAELAEAEAKAKAVEEAKRRRLTLALAATILLALTLAGGGGLWYQQEVATQREEAARREAELREAVVAALDKVTDLRQRAHWREARAVLDQVRQRLGPSGPEDLRRLVEQAEAHVALVDRLDAARLKASVWVGRHFDDASAAREYAAAFRDAGIGDETEAAEVVAQRIRASAVREQLVAAVDNYWVLSRGKRRAWLLAVARAADPDPWRNRFRDPEVWQDRSAIERLAREAKVSELSPQFLTGLGALLRDSGADPVPLLTAAQRHYPSDFWLSFKLAWALSNAKRLDEAIGYYRAALALRPGTPAVHNHLGNDLLAKGRVEEAIAEFQKAIEIAPMFAYAHLNLGKILCDNKHDYDAAIACFKKAIELGLEQDAIAHHDLGIALRGKGLVDEAVAEHKKAIELEPNDAHRHQGLGAILCDVKRDYDGAIACFRKAIDLDPKNADAHLCLGLALEHKGRVDEAITEFQQAIDLEPKNAKAHYELGTTLCEVKHDYDKAIACFRTAIELDPKFAKAHTNLGAALYGKGKVDDAIACSRTAIELDPKLARAHMNLGAALATKGQVDKAITSFKKAVELDPKDAKAHANLGKALQDKGQLDEAIACCKKAIELDPKFAGAHYNLGRAFRAKSQVDAAIASYKQAIELDPNDANAYNNLGRVLCETGQGHAAIASIKKAIELNPKSAAAHRNLGVILCDFKRDFDGAIASFKKAIELDPKDAVAHFNLGNALDHKGQMDEATASWRKAIELDPKHAGAHNNLGNALKNKGQLDAAIACFKKAVEIDPTKATAHYILGNALKHKGELDAAIGSYKRAIELKPNYAEAYCNLGLAMLQRGRFVESLAALKHGHELGTKQPGWRYPSAQWVRAAARLLAPGKLLDTIHEVGQGLKLRGRLDEQTPALVYQVKLAAGKTYMIEMVSPDPKAIDPFLVLSDAAGKMLAVDDDSGGGLNARIIFRPPQDGTFRIRAASVDSDRGEFNLTVREQLKKEDMR